MGIREGRKRRRSSHKTDCSTAPSGLKREWRAAILHAEYFEDGTHGDENDTQDDSTDGEGMSQTDRDCPKRRRIPEVSADTDELMQAAVLRLTGQRDRARKQRDRAHAFMVESKLYLSE